MKLHNSLIRKTQTLQPLDDNQVRIYSCGPTVYDKIHIGNLSAFTTADTLRRVIAANGYGVKHVMNFTDVDDKTIRRSSEQYPGLRPETALKKLTSTYEDIFLKDMHSIGNDVDSITFVRATDYISQMQELITELYDKGHAYITEDGVYFSIEKYRASGKTYGQLLHLDENNTSTARINNDEYDKESVHDFALWKLQKDNEPVWAFELNEQSLTGRPGWHIECSAMSMANLGQPFDIHTGGVDLIFPHHENEIAQSTATQPNPSYAQLFVHNEHILVDGKKMSKSLNNFFTLRDIVEQGYDPISFRLMLLQAHYRSQTNFTWTNLEAAQNRLKSYHSMADLKWQPSSDSIIDELTIKQVKHDMLEALNDDLNTPVALMHLSAFESLLEKQGISETIVKPFQEFLKWLDDVFGLNLSTRNDITYNQKQLIQDRESCRDIQDWKRADELRDQLVSFGIIIKDTSSGQIWSRI